MGDVFNAQLLMMEYEWDEYETEMENWLEETFSNDWVNTFRNKYDDACSYINALYNLYKQYQKKIYNMKRRI